jgi:hypothetical protein
MAFDWHSGDITRATPITTSYRNTQKVRRFFEAECGDGFKFDRSFMAWLKAAIGQTMGEAVEEWKRRNADRRGVCVSQGLYTNSKRAISAESAPSS